MFTQWFTVSTCFIVAVAIALAGAVRLFPVTEPPDHPSALRPKIDMGADPLLVAMVAPIPISRARRRKRGAIYARFSTKFQASIDDQVRACREWCDANDVDVPEGMVFTDRAVSGKKSRREGLGRLKDALNAKLVDVLVVFTTNRLHRNGYKARQFIEEEVVENGVRCLCLKSGIDTADEKQWRLLHTMNAMADEMMLGGTADAVRNANGGALLQKLVHGRLPHGYDGRPLEGRLTRLQRPKREVIVDPVTSAWVQRVFDWYVNVNLAIVDIVARLTAQVAPPPKGVGAWSEPIVRRMLGNERYAGRWAYGRTQLLWLNKRDYGVQEKRDTPLQEAFFPELRIINDATFAAAQAKLAGRNHAGGRKTADGDRRPRILNGLLWCAVHDRPLNHGDGFFCPDCRRCCDAARLYSAVPTDAAIGAVCRKLAELVRGDADLVRQVIESFQRQVDGLQRPDVSQLGELQRRKEKLTRGIAVLQRNMGETDEDVAESERALREQRSERATVDAEIAKLDERASRPLRVPSEAEATQVVDQLYDVLASAAVGRASADAAAVREVIVLLTGGKITCTQQGEAEAKRGWIRGSFAVCLLSSVCQNMGGGGDGEDPIGVDVDFVEPTEAELIADDVKALYDQQLPLKVIAKRMSKPYGLVRAALNHWFAARGQAREDGRARRARLTVKHVEPPLYQAIADEVKKLADGGLLFQQVARQLGVDRNTVTQAWRHWHASRGLVAAKGPQRRKTLVNKTEKPYRRRGGDDRDPHDRSTAAA